MQLSKAAPTKCCSGRPPLRPCRRLTVVRNAIYRPEQEIAARQQLSEAGKDIRPYILWDRVVRLSAAWDAAAASQADLSGVCETLEQLALGRITVAEAGDGGGRPLTALTVVCKPDDSDEVVAALLKWTPATHVTAAPCEQAYLPQHVLPVTTAFGPIDVGLSLAGSTVCKVTPNWSQCERAAAAAAAATATATAGEQQHGKVDAAAVAAAAVEGLDAGLADGSITLDAHLIF